MKEGEEWSIMEEDCNEDKLGSGYLVLTNKRLIFRKGRARMMTLTKDLGDIKLDITLDKVTDVRTEGFISKKVVVQVGDSVYKFGVFSTGKWRENIERARKDYRP